MEDRGLEERLNLQTTYFSNVLWPIAQVSPEILLRRGSPTLIQVGENLPGLYKCWKDSIIHRKKWRRS